MLHSHPSSLVPGVMLSRPAMPAAHHPRPEQENTENRELQKQISADAEAAMTANPFRLELPAKENEPPHQAERDSKPHQESDKHRTRRDTVV